MIKKALEGFAIGVGIVLFIGLMIAAAVQLGSMYGPFGVLSVFGFLIILFCTVAKMSSDD